ncbi:MAG: class I SAM-dependent methyltransferase [Pyrinomonadaceae bacterium]
MESVSNAHLDAIISNARWLEALNSWYREGGRPCQVSRNQLGLSSLSWADLQQHLRGTRWFTQADGLLMPSREGMDFLIRIDELRRAVGRVGKEDRITARMLNDLPRGPAVDVGCGPGHSVLRLVELGFAPVHGYDLSPVAVEVARALLVHEQRTAFIYMEDGTSLSRIEDGALALIYSRSAFQYFDQRNLARTLNRVLRPGGYVLAELVGVRYYVQKKHIRDLLRGRWRRFLSYWRTVLRSTLYAASGLQPMLAGFAPEIGYTRLSISRLARSAGLEVLSLSPAPSLVGSLVLMRKPE